MALTPKQKRFVEEYLIDQHATNAALRAGYPRASAHSIGSENLTKPEIRKLVDKGLALETAKIKKRAAKAGLTKERWLAELRSIAMTNMADLTELKTSEWESGSKGKKYSHQELLIKDSAEWKRNHARAIKRIVPGKSGIGIEMHSKIHALETLGKHYGWLKNEVELNLPDSGVKVEITMPSNGREAPKKPEDET